MDAEFCAGSENWDFYIDSGSPFTITNGCHRRMGHTQYGIYSKGDADHPAQFTDVSKYVDWILDNIKP